MSRASDLKALRELYIQGVNIMDHLADAGQSRFNHTAAIEASYDLQAGSYVRLAAEDPELHAAWASAVSGTIRDLDAPFSVVEVGVGDGTTLAPVVADLPPSVAAAYGFDLSWSRVRTAIDQVRGTPADGGPETRLAVGDLFSPPFGAGTIDVVYTAHSLEPNRGREREALAALARVAARWIVLLEPAYELADAEARERMDRLGYVRDLVGHARALGLGVVEHRLFEISKNPMNPTALTILKVGNDRPDDPADFACPISGGSLEPHGSTLYCAESLLAYPVVGDVPCLRPENAIVATQFERYLDHPARSRR